jgi:hypothetical protein
MLLSCSFACIFEVLNGIVQTANPCVIKERGRIMLATVRIWFGKMKS